MKAFPAFLARHDALLLVFCAMLFGIAYGLGHERGLVPVPHWYSPSLHRFCILLMAWTALLHSDPLQKLIWSMTDFVVLTLHFFAGYVFVPDLAMPNLIDYWIALSKVAAAASFGVAITQGVYSLLPGWRDAIVKRLPARRESPPAAEPAPSPIIVPSPAVTPVQPELTHIRPQILYRRRIVPAAPLGDTPLLPWRQVHQAPVCLTQTAG